MMRKKRASPASDNTAADALKQMNLQDIYRHEIVQSRHDRSRKAFFWARILGLALMLTIGATLRSEPELRSALASAGMDAIKSAASQTASTSASQTTHLPRDQVKVNRFGAAPAPRGDQLDAQLIANEVGRQLATQSYTN